MDHIEVVRLYLTCQAIADRCGVEFFFQGDYFIVRRADEKLFYTSQDINQMWSYLTAIDDLRELKWLNKMI